MASFGRNVVKTWHRAKAILGSVFCLMISWMFLSTAKRYVWENKYFPTDSPHSLKAILIFSIMGIILLLISALIIYYKILKPTQCPYCKKYFALKELDTEAVGSADVSVKVTTERRDNAGNVVGTQDQYVPGKRITYQRNYLCKKCGESSCGTFTKDKATI